MTDEGVLIGLAYNVALLLALGVIYDALSAQIEPQKTLNKILTGFFIGLVGAAVMLRPWPLVEGTRFDARAIALSVGALYFGTIPAVVAAVMTLVLRYCLGGIGATAGYLIILTSTAIGLLWRRLGKRRPSELRWRELYLFGLVVAVFMVVDLLAIPSPVREESLVVVGPPVLIIFPVVTVLLASILGQQETRRRTQRALAASQSRYAQFLQNFTGIAYQSPPGSFTPSFFHGLSEEITGYPADDFVAGLVKWQDLVHPDDLKEVERRNRHLAVTPGFVADDAYRIFHRDGTIHWVRDIGRTVDGGPGQGPIVQGAVYDITRQMESEEELLLTAQRLALATESAHIGVWDWDLETNCLSWDRQMYELYGVNPEGFSGEFEAWMTLVHPDDRERALADANEAVANSTDYVTQFRIIRPDGQIRHIEEHGAVLRRPTGAAHRMIGTSWDTTQRRELEAQSIQSQKMEAIGQLAGGIAHDFNNLLVPIIGFAELGLLRLPPDHELSPDLERILRAAERAADLTRQILAFSRQQVLEMEVINLNQVITEFAGMLRRLIGEDIEIRYQYADDLAPIRGDKGQLVQVLVNLAVNARDAMPNGGVLSIETANAFLDEAYTSNHPEVSPGHYALLAVNDTGHGIDETTKQHIFEPFFTTKAAGHGTGLGLSTVFGIVKQHHGSIWLYSEINRGTTFKVFLPVADVAVPDAGQAADSNTAVEGVETLLLVEDDASVRHLVIDMLERYGYRVLVASEPQQALAISQEHPGEIHLLLTDVIMPFLKGPELYRRLIETRPQMKVIFMSGYTDDVVIHQGSLEPGQAFIQKPFSIRDLLSKVRDVLD